MRSALERERRSPAESEKSLGGDAIEVRTFFGAGEHIFRARHQVPWQQQAHFFGLLVYANLAQLADKLRAFA
jgi:hypothetical protein